MKEFCRLVLLFLLTQSTLCCDAKELADLSLNSFHRKIHQIAGQEKLNVVVIAPDVEITGDHHLEKGFARLEKLVETAGCAVKKIGNAYLIVANKYFSRIEDPEMQFYFSGNRPAEFIADALKKSLPAKNAVKLVAEDNLLVLHGERKKIAEAQKLAENLDTSLTVFRISIRSIKATFSPTPDIAFLACSGVPTTIEFSDSGKTSLKLVVVAHERANSRIDLQTQVFAGDNQNQPIGEAQSEFAEKAVKSGGLKFIHVFEGFSGMFGLEIIEKTAALPAPFPKIKKERHIKTQKPVENEKMMNLAAIRASIAEVCEKVAAEAGTNFACGEGAMAEISLFCFGPELYYEELLNLIAKAGGLSLRKIGNTWIVAEDGSYMDHCEMSLYVTRRLQYANIDPAERFLTKFLEKTGQKTRNLLRRSKAGNALLFGGSGEGIDDLRRLLDFLDRQPGMLELEMKISTGEQSFRHKAEVASGKEVVQKMTVDGRAILAGFVPVVYAKSARTGLEYRCQTHGDNNEIEINGWTSLQGSLPATTVVSIGEELNPLIHVTLAARHLKPDESEVNVWNEDEPVTDDSSQESAFDDAFDSSF